MAEHIEGTGKTVRTTLESLVINVTNDELKYRSKYLPDPRRLSDDKIVCTVCSVSLASRVRKGKDIFIHSILGVLVCKNCHNFYGDGIFSTDEDGEDKYCRWCGQGGTLYLCSKCNCGFCKKCMMKNMKNSALAAIENDDWKCLICIPRPIFGSRAVCWASRELNNSVRKNELLRMRLEEEKKRIEVEKNLTGIKSEEENSAVIKKKKRVHDTDDSDSSTIFIPTKKPKKDAKTDKSLNGSVKKHRRKDENSSPDSELSDDDHSSKWEKRKRKRQNKQQSLSSEESSATSNKPRKNKKIKKKSKKSSSESSDSEESVSKSKTKKKVKKSFKTKRKNKLSKRKNETTSDSSSTMTLEKPKKKKNRHSKTKSLSDTSSDEDGRKCDSKGKPDIENPNETVEESDFDGKLGANNKDNSCDEVKLTLTEQIKLKDSGKSAENEVLDEKETDSPGKPDIVNGSETLPSATPSTKTSVLVNELDTLQNVDQPGLGAELSSFHENDQVNDDEYTLSYHESSPSDKSLCLSQEDEIKVKVQLAVEWLDGVSSDIADLGNLISERTNKFGEKKINEDKLCSYEDVLLTLGKLKQLLGGIHTNYKQIEDSLEDKLKSWKILAGLEKSDLEEQQYDVEEGGMEAESAPASEEIPTESGADTEIDVGESLNPEPNKSENELISESDSLGTFKEAEAPTTEPEIEPINECKENNIQNIVSEESACKQDPENLEKENEPEQPGNECLENVETKTEEAVDINEATVLQELESEVIDQAIVKAELDFKSGSSNMVWSGLLSSDDDSDLNNELTTVKNSISDNEESHAEDNQEPEVSQVTENNSEGLAESEVEKADGLDMKDKTPLEKEEEPTKNEDTDNFEALQELLYSSTEPEIGSSESDSEDSDDIQLDDSDLDEIFKPRKVIVKKSSKQKETKVKEETKENLHVKTDLEENKEDTEEKSPEKIEAEKEEEEPLDSEAEIDMLTDLTKLKKKTVLRRVEEEEESSNESSSESSQEEGSNEDLGEGKKRRKKYNTKIKKQREKERNELFGFLQGDSSAEDEADITKNDLDVMEDQYVSESSDSMSLEAFSRKMNEKWRELEKEQDQLNLEILLASESDQGSIGGNDILTDSDKDQKKKKEKKIKEEKVNDDEANVENEEKAEAEAEIKEEKAEAEAEIKEEKVSGEEPDQQYEEFLEGLTKTRTTFTGLGSSSEEDKDRDEIEIKEELLSDQDAKVKKEPKDSDEKSCTNSDSSSDLFLDLTKKKSEKKTIWRQHKLLKIKLSDTDTSDEERWWQRRLEREKKKKERGDDSPKKSQSLEKKKSENGSDKENKKNNKEKYKEEEEANSSSTLEMSSTDSSGSEVFKKKKKKKKDSTDSDIMIVSDTDKKKKKKKKRTNLSGDSSDESDGSDDDVIDITQKSSQGESPGKGGRKNIRKVKTKHELAAATKAAAKEEEERKKRIAARQKLFNEMFEIKEAEILEKLVLDFDPETKTELISVDKDLVTKMKPHQAKGVKFMWDSCFESLSQLKTKKGSGCILAHCMGLGKTFQVVSLVHTILTHKDTNVRTVLVVCPLSTVLNWFNEFDKWLEDVAGGRNIKIYHLTKFKKAHERSKQLSLWHRTGGVMIIGYEMFRILANPNSKKFRLMHTQVFQETLIDPGADLVVCDEGHMLKNESTLLSKAMSRIRTLRRIVLTGTPMQNNLKEYHCMVQFVKPNLLGTRKEFLNQFVNPITNGQFVDSTEADVKVMKRRAHVLHKMLEGLVQRFDYSVLTPFLPPKHEYVISLRLSDVQVKLYQFYLDYFCRQKSDDKRTSSQLFQDWQVLGRVWTHPRVLKMSFDKAEKERQKQESEDEGSIKDFINDKSSSSSLSLSSSSDDDENGEKKEKSKKKKDKKEKDLNKIDNEPEKKEAAVPKGSTTEPVDEINLISSEEEDVDKQEVEIIEKQNTETQENENKGNDSGIEDQEGKTGDEPVEEETSKTEEETIETEETTSKTDTDEKGEKESIEDEKPENNEEKNEKDKKTEAEQLPQLERRGAWWKDIVEPEHFEDINQSAKLIVLFAILRECEMIEDKVLVFSQSLFSLDLIEYFLQKVDRATEENRLDESLGNHAGCWQKGLDYFRLDGSSSSENRSIWCKSFNREDNPRARLFLISTRAGGLGINLTGANRVVIFDASWNPSHDIQSIFRIYRFGQKKPCYVYRFVAHGTMEEKVYERQVAKQLLSSRVVDEQQVQRHFSMSDLNELYTFTPPQERTEKPTPVLPKDMLMAELLTQYNDWIEKYHEHDSLLENIAEEELNEEERKLAWEDYENEKKRGFPPPTVGGVPNFPAVTNQLELFRKSLKLKFPNATDSEMNAMLHTLMFQVNRNNMSMMSQQAGAQQQLNQQNQASSSQQQQNFRPMNTNNKGPSQPFNSMTLKMNQVYQKPFGAQQMQQQRVSVNQMNQQRMGSGLRNQPMIGNGQIRKTNRSSQEVYMEEMRKQQAANLARIQNQKKFQQQFQQNNPGQQQTQRPRITRVDKGVARGPRLAPQAVQSNARMWGPQATQSSQQTRIIPNKLQQMQRKQNNALNILNARQQMQVSSVRSDAKPVGNSLQQRQWKTPSQIKQEEMRQRIKELQRQKNRQALQQRTQPASQKGSSIDPVSRQLEEMKKRYNASRKSSAGSSTPISIVELDDDPIL